MHLVGAPAARHNTDYGGEHACGGGWIGACQHTAQRRDACGNLRRCTTHAYEWCAGSEASGRVNRCCQRCRTARRRSTLRAWGRRRRLRTASPLRAAAAVGTRGDRCFAGAGCRERPPPRAWAPPVERNECQSNLAEECAHACRDRHRERHRHPYRESAAPLLAARLKPEDPSARHDQGRERCTGARSPRLSGR